MVEYASFWTKQRRRSLLYPSWSRGIFRRLKSQASHAHTPPASPTGRGEEVVEVVIDDDVVREVQNLEHGELVPGGGRRAEDELPPSSSPARAPAAFPSSCASPRPHGCQCHQPAATPHQKLGGAISHVYKCVLGCRCPRSFPEV